MEMQQVTYPTGTHPVGTTMEGKFMLFVLSDQVPTRLQDGVWIDGIHWSNQPPQCAMWGLEVDPRWDIRRVREAVSD